MAVHWTVGRRITAGFIVTTLLVLVVALLAIWALRDVTQRKDEVIDVFAQNRFDAATLTQLLGAEAAAVRGYLLTAQDSYKLDASENRRRFESVIATLQARLILDRGRAFVASTAAMKRQMDEVLDKLQNTSMEGQGVEEISNIYTQQVEPLVEAQLLEWGLFSSFLSEIMTERELAANQQAQRVQLLLLLAVGIAVLVGSLLAWLIGRYVTQQIGNAVAQIQSSSAQLQAASNEQAAGTREQTTAMAEVSTTLKELVATSRQIADSTQRVARIADETASAAQNGETTVGSAQQVLESIKRQVDLIVSHMIKLGKKTQQIGAIQELINELAEQTNILSINATIESAGAGEAGKRFAVVAEEIRKLADRVGGSGREIRALVDEVRSAANTTVIVTEDGSKAVDAGMRSFAEVASALNQISRMVDTSTEAARQIELGTRQQVTAVEQVNLTLVDLAQAAKEADASTRQTQETADYLSKLSSELLRMTRADVAR